MLLWYMLSSRHQQPWYWLLREIWCYFPKYFTFLLRIYTQKITWSCKIYIYVNPMIIYHNVHSCLNVLIACFRSQYVNINFKNAREGRKGKFLARGNLVIYINPAYTYKHVSIGRYMIPAIISIHPVNYNFCEFQTKTYMSQFQKSATGLIIPTPDIV